MKLALQLTMAVLIILLGTIVEYRVVAAIHGPGWYTEVPGVALQIAYGQADWEFTAGRVLLPQTVRWIATHQLVEWTTVWLWSVFTCLVIGNAVSYFGLWASRQTRGIAAPFAITQAAAFVAFQDTHVLNPSDLVDYITWAWFAMLVFRRSAWWWYVPLFALEIHNREVALFIPMWLLIDRSLSFERINGRWHISLRRVLVAGVACASIPAGAAYVRWLRHYCLTRTIPPHSEPQKWGQVWGWPSNVAGFKQAFHSGPYVTTGWQTRVEEWAFMAGTVMLVIGLVRFSVVTRRVGMALKLAILIGGFYGASLAFGLCDELRVWLCLIPFAMLLFLLPAEPTKSA
jgi:hypothetical protein